MEITSDTDKLQLMKMNPFFDSPKQKFNLNSEKLKQKQKDHQSNLNRFCQWVK